MQTAKRRENLFCYWSSGVAGFVRSPRARPFLAVGVIAGMWNFGRTFFVSQLIYLLTPQAIAGGFHSRYLLPHFSLFFAVLAGLALDAYMGGDQKQLFPARNTGQQQPVAGRADPRGLALILREHDEAVSEKRNTAAIALCALVVFDLVTIGCGMNFASISTPGGTHS